MRRTRTLKQRFEEKVFYGSPCGCHWWVGAIGAKGYGIMNCPPKRRLSHRVSYELFKGEIPEGLCVCHHCDNPACVNPDHLFLGTKSENTMDIRRGNSQRIKGRIKNRKHLNNYTLKFSHIKFRGGKIKRVYTAESESQARSFANYFSGYFYQFTPNDWYVII